MPSPNNYLSRRIRTAAILTTSHVAATVIENGDRSNQLDLILEYAKGSLTSLEVKIEFSDDNTVYAQETNSAVSGGVTTLSANEFTFTGTGNILISVPFAARYAKVSAKGTGTVTSSSLAIVAVTHNV